MIRHIIFFALMFALLTVFAQTSYSIDFNSLADQSSFRCSGGVVGIGDLDRDVREKCGPPFRSEADRISGLCGYIMKNRQIICTICLF